VPPAQGATVYAPASTAITLLRSYPAAKRPSSNTRSISLSADDAALERDEQHLPVRVDARCRRFPGIVVQLWNFFRGIEDRQSVAEPTDDPNRDQGLGQPCAPTGGAAMPWRQGTEVAVRASAANCCTVRQLRAVTLDPTTRSSNAGVSFERATPPA